MKVKQQYTLYFYGESGDGLFLFHPYFAPMTDRSSRFNGISRENREWDYHLCYGQQLTMASSNHTLYTIYIDGYYNG